jgi:hypothetical protein
MSQESTKPYLYFEQIMNGIVSVPESVKAKLSNVLLVRRQQLEKNREQEKTETETEKSSITSWFSSPEASSLETNVDEEPEKEKSKFSIASWFSSSNKESEESDSETVKEPEAVKQEQQLGENAKPGLDKCNIRGW